MTTASLLDELEPPKERWPNLQRPDWLTKDSAWVVLDRLKWGPACADDLWNTTRTTRAAARILDLTDRFGFEIIARPCTRHNHRGNNVEYVLVGVPAGVVA